MNDSFDIRKEKIKGDFDYENKVRPIEFCDFKGQEKIVENLKIFVKAALLRNESLDHVLLHGPPGLRKNHIGKYYCKRIGS